MRQLKIVYVAVKDLVPYDRNSRVHSPEQIAQIANSIQQFGFTNPLLIDARSVIIAGHGRLEGAKIAGLEKVPCIVLDHLSDRERQALVIADNKIALNAGWDMAILGAELGELANLDFDLSFTGFDEQELDAILKNDLGLLPDKKLDKKKTDKEPPPDNLSTAKSKIVHTCPNCSHKFSA